LARSLQLWTISWNVSKAVCQIEFSCSISPLSALLSQMVTYQDTQICFLLDNEENIQVLSGLLEETAVFGIQKRKPKLGMEFVTSERDTINVLSKVEFFLSMTYIKIRFHAFKYLVGDETDCVYLLKQLSDSQPPSQTCTEEPPTIRTNSKFDVKSSLFSC